MGCGQSLGRPKPAKVIKVRPADSSAKGGAPAAHALPPGKGPGKGKGKGKFIAKGKGKGKGKSMAWWAKGKGKGKSMAWWAKGKGKGKGGKRIKRASKFQIVLEDRWEDYGAEEDAILKRAYLVGHPNAKYHLRGQFYEYSFRSMKQMNLTTGRQRSIRPPRGMRQPRAPLLPPGAMVVITVKEGTAGQTIVINCPNNPGQQISVAVPRHARRGCKMAVPVPRKGETVADVQKRQAGWSTGSKVAAGVAAAGAAVGGVLLGDHLADGEFDTAIGEFVAEDAAPAVEAAAEDAAAWAEGAAEDAGPWAEGAAEDAAAWAEGAAEDAGEWAEGAAEDAGPWAEGAAEDAGEWAEGAAEDAGEWAEGAAEDAGPWAEGAAEDAGEWAEGAAEDAAAWAEDAAEDAALWTEDAADEFAEWMGDAAEDAGGFVMDLF